MATTYREWPPIKSAPIREVPTTVSFSKLTQGFSGLVQVEWLEDPRKMKLEKDLVYVDANGVEWTAPFGSIIDGASIPKFFWRFIGSPFIGHYRRASVIHDVYCDSKSRPAQMVHDCFKEMMLFDGVKKFKAWKMFQAVDKFGPRW